MLLMPVVIILEKLTCSFLVTLVVIVPVASAIAATCSDPVFSVLAYLSCCTRYGAEKDLIDHGRWEQNGLSWADFFGMHPKPYSSCH